MFNSNVSALFVEVYNPTKVRLGLSTEQFFNGDCNNKTVQNEIKKKFIAIFNKSLYGRLVGGCVGNKHYEVENVSVRCGKANLTIISTGSGNRKKRDVDIEKELTVTAGLKVPRGRRTEPQSQQQKKPKIPDVKYDKREEAAKETKEARFHCKDGQFLKNNYKCGK